MKRLILCAAALSSAVFAFAQPKLTEDNIDKIIKEMTLEEKAQLVVGAGKATTREGIPTGTIELVKGAAGMTKVIDRLGITAAVASDGPAGVRIDPSKEGTDETFYCTGFPVGILLASSWDEELVEKVTTAMGKEALEYGVDVLLAPGMNIHRNPLNGRNFEYFSEDPLLSGKMASAYIKGIQNNGVGVSVKHYAANNQETNRFNNNSVISQRALREIYLKNFEIAVKESKPWTVMASYNKLNGPYTCASKELLTTVLRNEWGFDGIVMTDWTPARETVNQLLAGNDLMMPGEADQREDVINAVKSGELSMKDLDKNVRRILEFVVKTPRFKGYDYSEKPDLKAHAQVAREAAAESMILLRNENNTLPMEGGKKIAIYGLGSKRFIAGGAGSGNVNKPYVVDMVEACENAGFIVNKDIINFYQANLDLYNATNKLGGRMLWPSARQEEPEMNPHFIERQAKSEDVAMIVITRNAWEGGDRPTYGGFDLSNEEKKLISDVSSAYHKENKKVVVVLNIGGAVETASWKDQVDAIVLPWTPGQEGANSIMDVITGKVNPSGKLPASFPVAVMDDPSMKNFPYDIDKRGGYDMNLKGAHRKDIDDTYYEEDIWVGYRYYNTAGKEVSYPFGYGLSYTTFEYGSPVVKADKNGFTAEITVTNTGDKAGREVVQLYVAAPEGGLDKPARELKGFAKTGMIQPGESETVVIKVDNYSLASFNEARSSWEAAAGEYKVMFGANVEDIRAEGAYSLSGVKRWKVNNVLKPNLPLETMTL